MFVVLCFAYMPFSSFYIAMKSFFFYLCLSPAAPDFKKEKKKLKRIRQKKKKSISIPADYRWVLFFYFIV